MPRLTYARLVKSLTKLHITVATQYSPGPRLNALHSAINEAIVAARAGIDGNTAAGSPGQIKHQLELRLNTINAQPDFSDENIFDNGDSNFIDVSSAATFSPKNQSSSSSAPSRPAVVSKRRISAPPTATKKPARVSKRTTRANPALPSSSKVLSPSSAKERAAAAALLELSSSSPLAPQQDSFQPINETTHMYTFSPLPILSTSDSREAVFFQGVQYAMRNLKGGVEAELQNFVLTGLGLRAVRSEEMRLGSCSKGRGFWDVV